MLEYMKVFIPASLP